MSARRSSPVVASVPARIAVFLSFLPSLLAPAINGHDTLWPIASTGLLAGGHYLGWRWRGKQGTLIRAGALIALLLWCAAFATLWFGITTFTSPLNTLQFLMGLAVLVSPFLSTRRRLYGAFLLSLLATHWSEWISFGWSAVLNVAVWVLCLAAFRHLCIAEEAGPSSRLWPGTSTFAYAAVTALVALVLAASGLMPLAPSVGLVYLQPTDAGAAFTPGAEVLNISSQLPAGDAVVLRAKTRVFSYWTGVTYDAYSTGKWTQVVRSGQDVPADVWFDSPGPDMGTYTQLFVTSQKQTGPIYVSRPTEHVSYPASSVHIDGYADLFGTMPANQLAVYSASSLILDWSPSALMADAPRLDFTERTAHRVSGLPGDNAALSLLVARGATNRYEVAVAVTRWLKTNNSYDPAASSSSDPVAELIYVKHRGNSLAFATSATLMLRSLNVPARLATGYAPSDWEPALGEASARAADWHVWVEVNFPGAGWVPFDPSPGFQDVPVPKAADRFSLGGIRRLIPDLPIFRKVTVKLNAPRPSVATSPSPSPSPSPHPSPSPTPQHAPPSIPPPAAVKPPPIVALAPAAALPVIPMAILGLALAGGLMAVAILIWRTRRAPPLLRSPTVKMYERLQRRLPRRRRAHETPAEYLASSNDSKHSDHLTHLTDLVHKEVYAGEEIGAGETELPASPRPHRGR